VHTPGQKLAWNSINYSYFPDSGGKRFAVKIDGLQIGNNDEAHATLAALSQPQHKLHDPQMLADLTAEKIAAVFEPADGAGPLPMLEERLASLKELGARFVCVVSGYFPLFSGCCELCLTSVLGL
jgi:hypothetical protein